MSTANPGQGIGVTPTKDTISLVVFIDALGWEVLKGRSFLEDELPLIPHRFPELGREMTLNQGAPAHPGGHEEGDDAHQQQGVFQESASGTARWSCCRRTRRSSSASSTRVRTAAWGARSTS